MKNLILFFTIAFFSLSAHAQKFEVTPQGVAPIVIQIDSLTVEQIYTKTKLWVNDAYKNPEEVIAVDEENVRLRLNAYSSAGYTVSAMGSTTVYPYDYTLNIQIKEGRIRLTYTPTDVYWQGSSSKLNLSKWFKSNGDVIKRYSEPKETLEEGMNLLLANLINFLNGESTEDDW